MLKVGVPAWIDEELLAKLPREIALERIESNPERQIEIEFWIAPTSARGFKQVLPHIHGLRVVQAMLAGVDWMKKLVPEGVVLCDGQGMHNIPTAEWTVTAILSSLKFFPFYRDLQHAREWQRLTEADATYRQLHRGEKLTTFKVLQEELYGKRVMIVGYGSIGRSIEERLLAFGAEIMRVARHPREGVESIERLTELLPYADVVVLIVPLTDETTGMIGAPELAKMKQGARPGCEYRRPRGSPAERQDPRRHRRNRPRASAQRPSALVRAQPAHHPAHRRLQPQVDGSRHRLRSRAGAPLSTRRTTKKHRHRKLLRQKYIRWKVPSF
jgi:phosphoglycerate dehydrogenase-like enzyme